MGAVVFGMPLVMPEPEGEAAAVVEVAPVEVAPEPVAEPEAPAVEPEAAVEVAKAPKAEPKPKASGKRRARHPAGADEARPSTYVGDDPSTPADEAWESESDAAKG